jgi:cell division inhibitor SepF
MSSVVIHSPATPDEVESLIDYLRRREPAIVNLDKPPVEIAQRILDMLSGAIYALNGSMHRIQDNIFLLTPEGVEIAAPSEEIK